jgi:hypothetical protein
MDEVFAIVNEIREDLPDRSLFHDESTLKSLARRLERSRTLRTLPTVQALVDDLHSFQPGQRLAATKEHINSRRDNHIFSLFNASYFPKLTLDYLTYDLLPTNQHLADHYSSNTTPVNVTGRTSGFGARAVVALFPENHIDGIQEPDDLIFYFIDKFVERHNRITRKLIDGVMAPASFPAVNRALHPQIEEACCWWVRLHEYHHRQGDMPIPDYLPAKSKKPLAGLEELRVDVSGMLACLTDEQLPREPALLTYEFILAERLLRYAVEGIPRPNYDAVASQLLFNYLREHAGIRVDKGRISLSPGLPDVLSQFLGAIQAIEHKIGDSPVADVQAELLSFTNQYTDYDPATRDYRHISFFADARQWLNV